MEKNIALPTLRRICRFSQPDFADKIGVSPSTVVAIENGTRSLTEATARKIMLATGAKPHSLISENSPRALDGETYTREHWNLWQKSLGDINRKTTLVEETLCKILKRRFETLLDSATASGRVFLLLEEFGVMLTRLLEDPEVERCYREKGKGLGYPRDLSQMSEWFLSDAAEELQQGLSAVKKSLLVLQGAQDPPMPSLTKRSSRKAPS